MHRLISYPVLAAICTIAVSVATGQISPASKVATLSDHRYDASASYCSGDNILFYNANTGEGAVGKISASGFNTTKSYSPGAFAPNWTHVAAVDYMNSVLFYNVNNGNAALGALDHGQFTTTKTYSNFSHGWTNILYAGLNDNQALFYNSANGKAALGFDPTKKTYPSGTFASGWSHIVRSGAALLFYNTYSGSGAVVVPYTSGSPGPLAGPNDLKTTKSFGDGGFSHDWTHVAATGSNILFYNSANGAAAVGTLTGSDFVTNKSYPAGQFSPHWTHIVAAGNLLLFYNSASGEGAIGEISGNQFRTIKTYPKDAFTHGFTHVVCAADAPPPPH